jgi:hypothetical protein
MVWFNCTTAFRTIREDANARAEFEPRERYLFLQSFYSVR